MAKAKTLGGGRRIIAGLTELHDALAAGAELNDRFTIREVEVMRPAAFTKARVRQLRDNLGMSQSVFAAAVGVSVELVRSWEMGKRQVGALAGRLLELVEADPIGFRSRVIAVASSSTSLSKRTGRRAVAG